MFLFQDKFAALHLAPAGVSEAMRKMATDRDYHVRNIDGIIKDQIEPTAAANLRAAGGAATIFDQVMELLRGRLGLLDGGA